MRLICWNVAGRKARQPAQAKVLARREADVVALQEVRAGTLGPWRGALAEMGLPHLADSGELAAGPSRCFNLIASRWALEPLAPLENPEPGEQFLPERYVAALVRRPGEAFELHNVHAPPGTSRGVTKVRTLEAVHARLAGTSRVPRILCGDLNSPLSESADGWVQTWAARHPEHRERWARAELSVLVGLAEWDLPDTYRGLNGYADGPTARRVDHVFASRALGAIACDYIHGWREERLSDHAAIEAEFARG